ncbi:glycosyltransferase family 2 protein [Candidatus Saccharibacteria bacterium]|nr:glycosyltransferase family 2 protein [Candidatus Saccharibacteria bacterium]
MVISIVIPMYNAEKYLKRCLDSVLVALKDTKGEIILVDDCSRDKTLGIAKAYQKKHGETIRVLQSEAHGASGARNMGARFAKGKYLWFIDADDYIREDSVSKLVEEAEKTGADIVMMGAKRVGWDENKSSPLSAVRKDEPNYKSRFVRYGIGPWQLLLRREWWVKHDLKFAEGIIHEDMELMSSLILFTDKFSSVDELLYYYCNNPNSILHKTKWDEKYFDIFPALEGLYGKFEKAGAVSKYHDELEWFFIWNLLIDSAADFKKFPEGRPGLARSRKMLKKYFPGWRKNRFLRGKPLKFQMRVRMNYWA